jgi:hypothetical protein
MNSSYRQIIHRILKEERMAESSIARLLEWYKSWDTKLAQSITEGDYAKIIDTHFKNGLYLLSALKNVSKKSPELKETLKEETEMVRSKLITINKARGLINSIK